MSTRHLGSRTFRDKYSDSKVHAVAGIMQDYHWDTMRGYIYNLLSPSHRKYQSFQLLPYFSVVVCLKWLYHHMRSVSYISHDSWAVFYCCAVLWCVQMIMSILWTDSRICLFAHYTTSLSSLCRRIRKYSISTILVKYNLSSVYLRLRQFSWLSFMQYMELFVLGLPISLIMIVRINVLYINIIIKSELWPIRHCSW